MKTFAVLALVSFAVISSLTVTRAASTQSSAGYSETQVKGITALAVDDLWVCTDYWWHRGEYPQIIADDRVITEADPHFLEPYSTGGWLMESLGNYPAAEAYYRLGALRNPKKSYMWFSLGFFYFNTLKDYPKAIDTFKLAALTPDGGVKSWKMLAHSYEKNNQLDKAVAVWQMLNTKYPNDGTIVHNLNRDQALLTSPTSASSPVVQ